VCGMIGREYLGYIGGGVAGVVVVVSVVGIRVGCSSVRVVGCCVNKSVVVVVVVVVGCVVVAGGGANELGGTQTRGCTGGACGSSTGSGCLSPPRPFLRSAPSSSSASSFSLPS